ncbi:phage tail protein [Biomaibacter acetigenes]|uniref:phage tail protein n=1 Tax=Biomaibacter acetigenes TaxID=2316383 RepID=UPI001CA39A18|nr:phage tail protein [Biomaibacter acetigenes]
MAGKARSYFDRFKFLVEIDGITQTGFQKCSELKGSVGKIEHREGGGLLPDKSPGFGNYSDITLEYGATKNLETYEWFRQVIDASQETGGAEPDEYKRNLSIIQLDRAGREVQRWNVYGAWPTDFVAGEWDSTSEEKTIRKLTLAIDYFEPA